MKKGFAKTKAQAKELAKKTGAKDTQKEDQEVAKGEGPLKGKLVRVVDETSLHCGRVIEVLGHAKGKLHGQVAWQEVTASFFDKAKVPAKVAMDDSSALPVEHIKNRVVAMESLAFQG